MCVKRNSKTKKYYKNTTDGWCHRRRCVQWTDGVYCFFFGLLFISVFIVVINLTYAFELEDIWWLFDGSPASPPVQILSIQQCRRIEWKKNRDWLANSIFSVVFLFLFKYCGTHIQTNNIILFTLGDNTSFTKITHNNNIERIPRIMSYMKITNRKRKQK